MAKIDVDNKIEDFRIELNVTNNCSTISIDSYTGEAEEVIVPSSFGGIPVTVVGSYAFFNKNEKIKHIILPEGIISIGNDAFNDCARLNGIVFPESLTSIEYDAFEDCTGLTKIHLPKRLVIIGDDVFSGCAKLTDITVDNDNPAYTAVDGVLFNKYMTTLVFYPEGRKGDYTVPDTVFEIYCDAFQNCRELTGITLPQGLLGGSDLTFSRCERLANIIISEQNLDYSSIDGVLFDKTKTSLLRYPPGRDNTDYTVPEKIECIEWRAFHKCKKLTKIILPKGLKVIKSCAFSNCEGLTALNLPMSLQLLAERAFEGCKNLEIVTLSRKTKLGYRALVGFSGQLVYRD